MLRALLLMTHATKITVLLTHYENFPINSIHEILLFIFTPLPNSPTCEKESKPITIKGNRLFRSLKLVSFILLLL